MFDHNSLRHLKQNNQTLKLLNSDNFAMNISFFHMAFTRAKTITLPQREIVQLFDDYLYELNARQDLYPKSARQYLDEFCARGWMRRYYESEDEPLYELTPSTNKALEWLESLQQREFVGSRTKFNLIFELLEQLDFETNYDTGQRVAKLEGDIAKIKMQIERIKNNEDLRFDETRIKEHFMQVTELSRKLQFDFSQIEQNFRELNKKTKERISGFEGAKAEVLETVFDYEEEIRQQDQGKSFYGFWQLLMDESQSQKLDALIQNCYRLDPIRQMDSDKKLGSLKYDLLKSGQKVYKLSTKLIEQLRRFMDERAWADNKRVLQLIGSIEKRALHIKDMPPKQKDFMEVTDMRPRLNLPFERKLFSVPLKQEFSHQLKHQKVDIDLDEALFDTDFVDETLLQKQVLKELSRHSQVSLRQILEKYPPTQGIGELIGYLNIASKMGQGYINKTAKEYVTVEGPDGADKRVSMPKIIFLKEL